MHNPLPSFSTLSSLPSLLTQKLELHRLEQRYTHRRNRRSVYASGATYRDGEYFYGAQAGCNGSFGTGYDFDGTAMGVDAPKDGKARNGRRGAGYGYSVNCSAGVLELKKIDKSERGREKGRGEKERDRDDRRSSGERSQKEEEQREKIQEEDEEGNEEVKKDEIDELEKRKQRRRGKRMSVLGMDWMKAGGEVKDEKNEKGTQGEGDRIKRRRSLLVLGIGESRVAAA